MEKGAIHLLIAGGGTGGHVFPGLSVAEASRRRGWRVSWAGRPRGMELRLVEGSGLAYHALPARAVLGRGPASRAVALTTLLVSALRARSLLRRVEAQAVLGTGGFVSAPAVLGAGLAGLPAVLLEPNAEPGAANRWLSRWARAAAVAFPQAAGALRCPARHTGVPVREAFFASAEEPPAADSLRLLVLGGSQGALQLNRMLPPALARLAGRFPGLRVVHQVGEAHAEATRSVYRGLDLADIETEITPFLDDVAGAMAAAHLVVSRAGAVALAEICAAGRPALVVPLAGAEGHQLANAEALAATGGAVVLAAGEQTPAGCARALAELLADGGRRRRMGRALRRLARPGAAEEIADLVQTVVEAA